ncbi:MAG: hypothetical protein M3303_04135 [Gemmatimonadota bacterium]|nr:hypothetical protein [Gemmatimonadota bacterium]
MSRRLFPAGALVAGVALVACFELSGAPSGLSSISRLELAWPAVVVGDSLRDSTGAAAPLRVEAFDADGRLVTDAQVTFIALDTGLRVTAAGFVLGERPRTAPAKIVAQVQRGGDVLQTPEIDVDVVPRPDTVFPAADTLDVKVYTLAGIADTSWITSDTVNVTVSNRSRLVTDPGTAGVRSWIVRYEITDAPMGVDNAATAFFAGAGNPGVAVDTTDANGVAGRRVILRTIVLPAESKVSTHEVEVTVTVRERGQNVPGSPIQVIVPFEIRNPQ